MNDATIADRRFVTNRLLGQALEPRLGEMLIESKRGLDPLAFHHDKRHTVG